MDRIEPGDPSNSAIIQRQLRNPSAGDTQQMPPVGRELVDDRRSAGGGLDLTDVPLSDRVSEKMLGR